jgi:hypothetical protein
LLQAGAGGLVNILFLSVENEPTPSVVHQKEKSVGLKIILHAELDERFVE